MPNAGRRSKAESDLLRQKIVQDLKAGLSNTQIAKAHSVNVRWVQKISSEHQDEILSNNDEVLTRRQAKIDQFLEDETMDLLEICRLSTLNLKDALKRQRLKIDTNEEFIPSELVITTPNTVKEHNKQVTKGKKTLRSISVHDLETSLKVWKETHSILALFQQKAED